MALLSRAKIENDEVLDGIYLLFTHIGIWLDSGYSWGMAMSDEVTKGCLTHYDNRHIQVRFDFLGICTYDKAWFKDRPKEEPNRECMAKILRLFETLTDHARTSWQLKAVNAKEKGLTVPQEPEDYRFELTNGAIVSLLYNTFGESTMRNSLDQLLLMDCIGRYQEKNNSIPVYWLKFNVVQALLKIQAENELKGYEIKPQTSRGMKSNPKRPKSNPSPMISNPEPTILDPTGFESTDNNISNIDKTNEKDRFEVASAIASATSTPFEQEEIPIVTPKASIPFIEVTRVSENTSHSQEHKPVVSVMPVSESKPTQHPPKPPRKQIPKSTLDDVTQKRVDDFYSYLDELKQEVLGDATSAYQRTQKATDAIIAILPLVPTQRKVKKVFLDMWNEKGKDGQYFWRRHMKPHNICSEYESRIMALEGKTLPSADAPVRNIVRADERMREQYRLDRERAAQRRKAN